MAFIRGAWGIGTVGEHPGHDGERVTENRLAESGRAAKNRRSEIHFFDMGDYPMVPNGQDVVGLANQFGEHRRAIVLTHGFEVPYNIDQPMASDRTLKARVCAEAPGYPAEGKGSRDDAPPEECSFRPPVLLEITSMRERQQNAMESMAAQEHLVKYFTVIGERGAVAAASDSGKRHIQCAEAFQRSDPRVTDRFS